MPTPKSTVWAVEPHTSAKHVILEKYLQAWYPIMSLSKGRVIVLDGFAGPGEYEGGQKGSPLIALDTLLTHGYTSLHAKEILFLFIEKDSKRCAHLKSVLSTRTLPEKISCHVYCGTFNETLSELLNLLDERESVLAPTFAFVDPFGYGETPMSTIGRLMKHPSCEILINFMYEELNRFITFNNAAHQSRVDGLFGTTTWRRIPFASLSPTERERSIHDLYQRQLQSAGGARYVRSFRMMNKRNRTDYYLFFGTNHLKGLDKMKQVMWKVDASGTYVFSDCTNPDQPMLFTQNPDYSGLQQLLIKQFKGKTVTIRDIEDYVIAETAFHSGQYKKNALKILEQQDKVIVLSPLAKRRKGTYPDTEMKLCFV